MELRAFMMGRTDAWQINCVCPSTHTTLHLRQASSIARCTSDFLAICTRAKLLCTILCSFGADNLIPIFRFEHFVQW